MGWEKTGVLKQVHYNQSILIPWINKSDQFLLVEIPHAASEVGCYDLKSKWIYASL